MKNILVSVIIPVYKTNIVLIQRCLNSIFSGSFNNYEILIIDDGNDETYAKKLDTLNNEKIFVIHNPHMGVSFARNKGIDEAKGKYIAFIDGDDEVSPDFLAQAYSQAEHYNLDIICGGVRYLQANNPGIYHDYMLDLHGKEICIFNGAEKDVLIKNLLVDGAPNPDFANYTNGSVSWKLYRKELVKKVMFNQSIEIFEDRLFNINIFDKASIIGVTDKIWYFYYQYGNSSIHRYQSAMLTNTANVFRECSQISKRKPQLTPYFCKWYMSNIYTCLYLDLINADNPHSFLKNGRRFKEWLNKEPWTTISKEFDYSILPLHSKFAAILCRKKLAIPMMLYYKVASRFKK